MHMLTLKMCTFNSWIMAIIYYWIEIEMGVEFKLLLYAAIVTLAAGLYLSGRKNKETTKGEA